MYSVIGTNCIPKTMALTSNAKFLAPLNNLYNETDNTLKDNDDKYFKFGDFRSSDFGDDLLDTNPRLEIKGRRQENDDENSSMYGKRLRECKNC